MRCFHCNEEIKGRVRHVTIGGERVPFHYGTVALDCVNEYLKSQQPPSRKEVLYSLRHARAHA